MKAIDQIGKDAAVLSLVEVGLGSLLHGLNVPLAGQFLSINQAFLLTRSVKRIEPKSEAKRAPFSVSLITAILKSLAPAGKKLTPMLAISLQGLFYALGTITFGANLPGVVLGCVLLSPWAVLQPILIFYLLFGKALIQATEFYLQKFYEVFPHIPTRVGQLILILLLIRALICVGAGLTGYFLGNDRALAYEKRLLDLGRRQTVGLEESPEPLGNLAAVRAALRDLFRPLFLIFLAMTFVFFRFSESAEASWIWVLLRPIALGFIIFFLIRRFSMAPLISALKRFGLVHFSASLETAVQTIKSL